MNKEVIEIIEELANRYGHEESYIKCDWFLITFGYGSFYYVNLIENKDRLATFRLYKGNDSAVRLTNLLKPRGYITLVKE